jgi:hypothetical protein
LQVIGRSHLRHFRHLGIALLALVILIPVSATGVGRQLAAPPPGEPMLDVKFSLISGSYDHGLRLRLSSAQPDAAIYFTTDGSIPTADTGTLYTTALDLPANPPRAAVIRARAVLPDGRSGPVQNASYLLGLDSDLPVLSLITDPANLWDEASGIFANPEAVGRAWEREADLFFLEPDGSGFHAPAGIRVHGAASRRYEKKGLRFYFRNDYGLPLLDYPVFPDLNELIFDRLVLHNGGQDFPAISVSATMLRNQLAGNLARKLGAYATHSRPVLVFINGELWGVYLLRERIDARYLAENFQINDADLLSGFEDRLDVSAGDLAHWENLLQFVTNNDLADEANMGYVETQMNLDNYIDYIAFQIISANSDWPHNNQHKFRDRATGRWHWMVWDSDYAFGLLPDSYIEKDMFLHVLENEGRRQREAAVFMKKLFENPGFEAQFLTSLADQLNTVFLPDDVVQEIDRLAAAMARDISYETRRWPGSGDWEAGVEYMREFGRQRPSYVRRQAVDYFDLPGTAVLRVNPAPGNHGGVTINGRIALQPQQLPWEGVYFQGVPVQITAVPEAGYRFAGWEPADLKQTPSITLTLNSDLALTPLFEAKENNGPQPGDVQLLRYGGDNDPAPRADLQGDWVELLVRKPGGADLRGWRVTDNDTPASTDEGSLILGDHPALADVPPGTTILLAATRSAANDLRFPEDNLSPGSGQMVLYAGNNNLDTDSDPWFALGPDDNLVLLAPGPSLEFADDVAIDFLTIGRGNSAITSGTFGLPDRDD